mmetsp:Transcript_28813/g.85263  ORF Transcript_28813/g.85263 Transcript_28813/m.85263 type:complete len:356 (+) Transcript_28813:2894-3961(+)
MRLAISATSAFLGAVSLPSPPTRMSVACALVATLRHSGSATSFDTFSSSGSSLGRNGAASAGFSTSLAMLSMMTADLRLMAVARSRRPRTSRGTMMESGGPSTCCTKVVAASWWMQSDVSAGLRMQAMRAGRNLVISLLPLTANVSLSASSVASFTWGFASAMVSVSWGTISESAAAIWLGAVFAMPASDSSARTLVCQFLACSIPVNRYPSTMAVEYGFNTPKIALAASTAASLTGAALSAARSSRLGMSDTRYGSAALPNSATNALTAFSAFSFSVTSEDVVAFASASVAAVMHEMPFFFTSATASDDTSLVDSLAKASVRAADILNGLDEGVGGQPAAAASFLLWLWEMRAR